MKSILICSATEKEISDFIKNNAFTKTGSLEYSKKNSHTEMTIIIIGCGRHSAIYNLTKIFSQRKFDLVILAGVCGSYNLNDKPGMMFVTDKAAFADAGIIDQNNNFIPLNETDFFLNDNLKYNKGYLTNSRAEYFSKLFNIEKASVNEVCITLTDKTTLDRIKKYFDSRLETMESASFYYVCKRENITFVELRCCSNRVAPKNEEVWNLSFAIECLDLFLQRIFFKNITDGDNPYYFYQ